MYMQKASLTKVYIDRRGVPVWDWLSKEFALSVCYDEKGE